MNDQVSMVIEIVVFAIGIYLILRFLRATRGSGVIRGLSLILIGTLIASAILINPMPCVIAWLNSPIISPALAATTVAPTISSFPFRT